MSYGFTITLICDCLRRRAQQDFLRFWLLDLVSAVAQKVGGVDAAFYSDLARCAQSFCQAEFRYRGGLV